MKKTVVTLAVVLLAICSFANPPVTEAVLKQFNAVFPAAENARWFEADDHYDVYFEKDEVKYNIRYDKNGKIVSTRNYYTGAKLCPFLKSKLAEKYPGKTVFGVTEITNSNEMFYVINLEDDKKWTTVRVDAVGQINEVEKLNKAPK
jgi:hypothetical protein